MFLEFKTVILLYTQSHKCFKELHIHSKVQHIFIKKKTTVGNYLKKTKQLFWNLSKPCSFLDLTPMVISFQSFQTNKQKNPHSSKNGLCPTTLTKLLNCFCCFFWPNQVFSTFSLHCIKDCEQQKQTFFVTNMQFPKNVSNVTKTTTQMLCPEMAFNTVKWLMLRVVNFFI